MRNGVAFVLAGDYNVVPTEEDIYLSKSWAKDTLVQPASCAAFRRLVDHGSTDVIRTRHRNKPVRIFWYYL